MPKIVVMIMMVTFLATGNELHPEVYPKPSFILLKRGSFDENCSMRVTNLRKEVARN